MRNTLLSLIALTLAAQAQAAPSSAFQSAQELEVAGTGQAQKRSRTLYVTGEPAQVFMNPDQLEVMPEGFKPEDLDAYEIAYRMFGKTEKITAVKGTEFNKGEQVEWSGVVSEDGEWIQVEKGGLYGWIKKSETTSPSSKNWNPAIKAAFKTREVPKDQRRRAFIEEALSHVGKPYVWGGRSPKTGFDCSGLVQYSMDVAMPGNSVPRVSRSQQAAARPISDASQLKEGDLVFTGNPVKHVMIVVAENGELVEAMGRKWGIRKSELSRRIGGKPHTFGTFFED